MQNLSLVVMCRLRQRVLRNGPRTEAPSDRRTRLSGAHGGARAALGIGFSLDQARPEPWADPRADHGRPRRTRVGRPRVSRPFRTAASPPGLQDVAAARRGRLLLY